jgi:predicted membrane protein
MKQIIKELKHHAPFTASATIIAVILAGFFYSFNKVVSEETFHWFHFLHIVASAMVTSALFYKYKKNLISAILVGVLGAIIIGSISDVFFPYLGWTSLKLDIHFHLPLIEETLLVLFFAFLGSFLGVSIKKTKQPHFVHVFLSVFASLFYLLAFSSGFNLIYYLGAFLIVFLAVLVPCCLSDIVFPFFFLNEDSSE